MDARDLLADYDAHLRAHVPEPPPVGAVVQRDGPLVSVHYGTHAVVDHADTTGADVTGLVRRRQEEAHRRSEPVEWRVHSHDSQGLAGALRAAGFAPGWERSVLVAPLGAVPDVAPPPHHTLLTGRDHGDDQAALLAEESAPHRRPLSEMRADGTQLEELDLKLVRDGTVRAVAWFHLLKGTPFVAVEGMTSPWPALLSAMTEWTRPTLPRIWGWCGAGTRFVVAEADGDLRRMYLGAGFQEVTTVRSHHWSPPGAPATERPVRQLFSEPEYDDLWDRFYERFSFAPSVKVHPGIREPEASATWFLDGPGPALDQVIVPALLTLARTGESLYWLDWNHVGFRFDPRRVGGPGRPDVPGQVFPDGDYYVYTTPDLRLGTFGHPWENTLCVFGRDLLDRVEDGVTALLGEPARRGGRNTRRV
ncbi:DUF2716 domain-containing protein [Nocardiopsis sp. NRRL B-16309]|uniref:DUF2716 domain-containing protein n=1 Tax=Nocardiopsis sp. NRRL B-16309 TaxID=1519494 RepID=UPI0006AE3626|nr:DUF2716 domain-containing protein [Nocardiopsis sp. NRRL B-16309]KOX16320.1 hypothetical protein ADL05_12670 [Nocardiopsis sp. NRRL B-16309]